MLTLWPVDSLVKVFPDDRAPAQQGAIEVLAARGAIESGQFALQSDRDVARLEIRIEPPVSADGKNRLDGIYWRRVEFVPVHSPAFCLDPSERLRPGASFFPDPLLDEEAIAGIYPNTGWCEANTGFVPGGMTIPIWLTLPVPEDAVPGRYEGRITVISEASESSLPLVVMVSPALLPAARTLKLTHWFSAAHIANAAGVTPWSEAHWHLLALWARNLADHRANVVLTPITELLRLTRDLQWKLHVDFTAFDRWVETFLQAGAIGYIEGGHLAARYHGWDNGFGLTPFTVYHANSGRPDKLESWPVEDTATRDFLADLLPQLVAHLRERGWLERYFQHLADEPVAGNAASYQSLADTVRSSAPELRRLDATMADASLTGTVNIWCPQSKEAEHDLAFFQARQAAGDEVWHYTCLAPNGSYPNRFINQPLLGTRVLHWFNFTAGLTGYLHWGWNQWNGFDTAISPFCDLESRSPQGRHNLPGGDTHIMYPGPHGRPLDSIRHEMVLEGVQDYELLKVLEAQRPEKARQLGTQVVPTLTQYLRDPQRFRLVRARLLTLVAEVQR